MVASGCQIVFPPLENPNFHCGHCMSAVYLCNCCGVGHGKDYVLLGLLPLPSHPTPVERLVRWAAITSAHPGTSHFDARRFVRDMVDRNMLFTLSMERARLSQMAEDHARKLAELSEAARLPALFAAGRLDGTPAAQLAALQAMCEGAMEKLLMCDWAGMSPLEVALCQNAFQTSDPARYPLGDAGLQLVYDVIGVLTTVHRWAFSTRGWHLRLEAPASLAAAAGFSIANCMDGGMRGAPHGIGRDSLSSRSDDSTPAADGWSPDFPSHDPADLKAAISQDMSSHQPQEGGLQPMTPM